MKNIECYRRFSNRVSVFTQTQTPVALAQAVAAARIAWDALYISAIDPYPSLYEEAAMFGYTLDALETQANCFREVTVGLLSAKSAIQEYRKRFEALKAGGMAAVDAISHESVG